jgi:dihydroorotate dehydrogenase electron transfer subunit
MRLHVATIVNNTIVRPGVYLIEMQAPHLVQAVRPGQYCMLRCCHFQASDPLLRRPFYIAGIQRDRGTCTVLVHVRGRGTAWLAGLREGAAVDLLGPLGRGWTIRPTVRNLLLLCEEAQIAPLLLLAQVALEQELAVTLVSRLHDEREAYPPALLPPEAEYHIVAGDSDLGGDTDPFERLEGYLRWADAICCSVSHETLLALYNRSERVRSKNFAQATLSRPLPCGTGVCYACGTETRSGQKLVCRDGPVFEAGEIAR